MGYIGAGISRFNTADELTVTGDAEFKGSVNLGDNDKAIFGAGSDLQIYHDGSNSFIDDSGTGSSNIRGSQVNIGKYTGEDMITAVADGAVTLYHNNAAKLATTSTGVNVTGNIDFSGGILRSNSSVQFVMDADNNGGEVFVWGHNASNATTNELMRLNSSGQLSIGSTASSEKLRVSGNIEVYNDDVDGYIWFHDPNTRSWSVGSDRSTGRFVISSVQGIASNLEFQIDASGNVITTGSITANGGFVGAGNTPNFGAKRSNAQTTNVNTWTKVDFNTEIVDSDGKFDISADRFTPTVAGTYIIHGQLANNNLYNQASLEVAVYKNGSLLAMSEIVANNSTSNRNYTVNVTAIDVADTDDYYELYGRQQLGNGVAITEGSRNIFLGYKI